VKKRLLSLAVCLVAVGVVGCHRPAAKLDYNRPLPPGQLALRKITDPEQIPDFTYGCYSMAGMRKAIDASLNYLSKPSSRQFFPYGRITHTRAVESLHLFRRLIDSGLRGEQLNSAIRRNFDVYMSVGCDDRGTVLFTGYYTPIFDGSAEPTARFKYPLYAPPDNLVKDRYGQVLGLRLANGEISPCPTRAELSRSGILAGKELFWLADPFEVYIAQVQGSVKLRMPDGRLVTASYAASNGHEYRSVAQKLIDDGRIPADKMSRAAMMDYFKQHPDQVDECTRYNDRFVFFRVSQGPPRGSLNEPVTPLRTIATDKSIYPRACLAFIDTTLPAIINGRIYHDPYMGFALDQDTGGAIRAAGRCDIYMGIGDDAGRLAGQTYRQGKLYYLFAKQQPLVAEADFISQQAPQADKTAAQLVPGPADRSRSLPKAQH